MRAFIVLCLVAAVCAQYNYQIGGDNGGAGGVGAGGIGSGLSNGGVGSGLSVGGIGSGLLNGGISSGLSIGGIGSGLSSGGSGLGLSSGGSGLGLSSGASGLGLSSGSIGSGLSSGSIGSGLSNAGVGSGLSLGGLGDGSSLSGASSGPSFGASSSAPSFAPSEQAFGGLEQSSGDAPAFAPQAELEKEFYTFSANEEDFNEPAASNQIASSVKQGLRVVFIKGPENHGLEEAALNLARQAADQKTAIYVLNKQTDLSELANRLNNENKNINKKPEVHFVKYRTPEDAVNAQKAIQSQYDSLGGLSKNIDGGIAPSLNFASQAPAAAGHLGAASGPAGVAAGGNLGASSGLGGIATGGHLGAASGLGGIAAGGHLGAASGLGGIAAAAGPSATYLPASIIRRFRL